MSFGSFCKISWNSWLGSRPPCSSLISLYILYNITCGVTCNAMDYHLHGIGKLWEGRVAHPTLGGGEWGKVKCKYLQQLSMLQNTIIQKKVYKNTKYKIQIREIFTSVNCSRAVRALALPWIAAISIGVDFSVTQLSSCPVASCCRPVAIASILRGKKTCSGRMIFWTDLQDSDNDTLRPTVSWHGRPGHKKLHAVAAFFLPWL